MFCRAFSTASRRIILMGFLSAFPEFLRMCIAFANDCARMIASLGIARMTAFFGIALFPAWHCCW